MGFRDLEAMETYGQHLQQDGKMLAMVIFDGKLKTAGQRVSLTTTGPRPSF